MIKNNSIYNLAVLVLFLLVLCCNVKAQKKRAKSDALSIIKEFVQLSNVHDQLPLSLAMDVQHTTNFPTSEEDTAFMHAQLFIDNNSAYLRFGKTEQMINDSLTLVVSDEMERMFLYQNTQSVRERINLFGGVQLKDSSIEAIGRKYTAETVFSGEIASIVLTTKSFLYGTSFPKEVIELQYNTKTKLLLKSAILKRKLLPLKEEDYKILSNEPGTKNIMVSIEDKAYFLVKEESTAFIYKEIGHGPFKFPATIKERISKNEEGEYVPVKNYEVYTVTIN